MNDEKILAFLRSSIWTEHQRGSAAEAYLDLLLCSVSERPSSYIEMAERWKVTRQTASKWCAEMRSLGLDSDMLIEQAKDYRSIQRYCEREEAKKKADEMPKSVGAVPKSVGTVPKEIDTDEYELLDDVNETNTDAQYLHTQAGSILHGGESSAQKMRKSVVADNSGVNENNNCENNLHSGVKDFYTDVNENNTPRAHEVKLNNNIHNIQNIQHSPNRVYACERDFVEKGNGLAPAGAANAHAAGRAREGQTLVGAPAGAANAHAAGRALATHDEGSDGPCPPSPDDVQAYINQLGGAQFSGQFFVDYYTGRCQWNEVNVQPRVWRAMVRKWRENDRKRPEPAQQQGYAQGRPAPQQPQQQGYAQGRPATLQQQGYAQGRPAAQPQQGYAQSRPAAQQQPLQAYAQGHPATQQQQQPQITTDEMVRAMMGTIYGSTYYDGGAQQGGLSYAEQLRRIQASLPSDYEDGLPF